MAVRVVVALLSCTIVTTRPIKSTKFNQYSEIGIDLHVENDGEWSTLIGGDVWFTGRGVLFKHEGTTFCSSADLNDQCSSILGSPIRDSYSGSDRLGSYDAVVLTYPTNTVRFESIFKVYRDKKTVVFEQRQPDGLVGTEGRKASDELLTRFPIIDVSENGLPKGYLQYKDQMAGSKPYFGPWIAGETGLGSGLMNTAPIIVFDGQGDVTAVWSVAQSFMAVNQVTDVSPNATVLSFGLMGSILDVPPLFTSSVILSIDWGINTAIRSWGAKLLQMYGNSRAYTNGDFTLNTLGYSTDNGAYYYYFTEGRMNYEDTLLAVHSDAKNSNLPIRHILLDSWWYFKGPDDGVMTWEPRPDIFPHGLESFYEKTQWPVVAHNRWWDKQATYAKQNGGAYDFIVERENHASIPMDQRFWDDLMANHTRWGLRVYEQDWLHNEFEKLNATLTSATVAREWLLQMGSAAQRTGITIQYCMAWCRHLLQSVEVPAVTQVRASDDYHPGNDQWRLGITSLIVSALGLRPSKDNWWSTPVNTWLNQGRDRETRNRLQGLVAILSTGPYTPGDRINTADVALILKGCMSDGTLLQPDRPATAIDSNIAHRANNTFVGPGGEVWSTEVSIGSRVWHYLLSVNDEEVFHLQPRDLHIAEGQYMVREANVTTAVQLFSDAAPLALNPSNEWSFQFFTIAPVLENGWIILGELYKWVPVTQARFQWIKTTTVGDAQVSLGLKGCIGEEVQIGYVKPGSTTISIVTCLFKTNAITIELPSEVCIPY